MSTLISKFNLHPGDLWPYGAFSSIPLPDLMDTIVTHFDVPCWPELLGDSVSSIEDGFWKKWFLDSLQSPESPSREFYSNPLLLRPGFRSFYERYVSVQLLSVKGHMAGPGNLYKSVLKERAHTSPTEVVEFLLNAFDLQSECLSHISRHRCIMLDEPAAFLVPQIEDHWTDFLERLAGQNYYETAVGLQCGGELSWQWVNLGWEFLHLDALELHQAVLHHPAEWNHELSKFVKSGGWLILGFPISSPLIWEPEIELKEALLDIFEVLESDIKSKVLLSSSSGVIASDRHELEVRLKHLQFLQGSVEWN